MIQFYRNFLAVIGDLPNSGGLAGTHLIGPGRGRIYLFQDNQKGFCFLVWKQDKLIPTRPSKCKKFTLTKLSVSNLPESARILTKGELATKCCNCLTRGFQLK